LDPSSPGILLTGLTLIYSADPADDGKDVTLRWHGSRPFDISGGPPFLFFNSSHLDGSVVYDATKFSVNELALQTNFLDIYGPATLQIGPVLSGVPFTGTAAGPSVPLPLGSRAVINFFAMTFHQISATSADTITLVLPGSLISKAVPSVLPFAALAARLEVERRKGKFELAAVFDLDPASDGIHPLTEDVTLQIGTLSVTIPAGSFRTGADENDGKHRDDKAGHEDHDKKGKRQERFEFQGIIDGVSVEMKIIQTGSNRFTFKAEGRGANLSGIVNPVTVGLTIGDDGGSISVTAHIESHERQR
jgi:hypothetical protein